MSERQPNRPPIPAPQHTPHEGGNGAPGLPPSLNERAKPPPENAQPVQGRSEGETVFSLGEQKGSDTSRFIPEIEKRIQRLTQPYEGDDPDVNHVIRRVLQGLHDLEEGRHIGLRRSQPPEGERWRKSNWKAVDELRRSYIELTGQEPHKGIVTEGHPVQGSAAYADGYIQALEDILRFIPPTRPAEQDDKS
jgi:hypothetical protein